MIDKVRVFRDSNRYVYASVRKRRKGKPYKLFYLASGDTMRRASRWKIIHTHKGESMIYDLKHDVAYEKPPKKVRARA